ncbi:MAG TPA: LytTR family DNA-binding domain-containing protein [Caulobacteraceae bacterium]|nr:LytTR family DNA-binding domain-containing protein [Caulobacteraceae bacterium]
MADRAGDDPEDWADRRDRRDGEPAPGTSGGESVTGGVFFSLRAWLVVLALLTLNLFVNVMTQLDDAHRRGVAMPLALPVTLEFTSAVAATLSAFIVFAAVRLFPPNRQPIWRTLPAHLGASLLFSATHVGLMTLLRTVVFAAAGHVYSWSPQELPYEYRKDLVSYVVIAGVAWLLIRPRSPPEPAPRVARTDATSPATFDIRDGASILRVRVAEILAAKAAGNYVEFALEDGRRPLMRASMAQIEDALAPHGFVRPHRSWLVNAARVRGLSATGAGDYRIDLGEGVVAPASRRYPAALAQLRGEG